MERILEGQCVVITGAFGALGAAVTRAALDAGATVAAVDRADAAKAPGPADRLKAWGGVDLSTRAAAAKTFEDIAQSFGAIHALVNIAGAFKWQTVADGTLEAWDELYNINLRTAVSATQAALPHLLKGTSSGRGRIVNIGAAAATHAGAGMGAYAAAKSGVGRLTEALAAELKDRHITVNAILPSIIDTPANRKDMPGAEFDRWVRPEQAADVIIFLLSPRSSAITGALIPVVGRV